MAVNLAAETRAADAGEPNISFHLDIGTAVFFLPHPAALYKLALFARSNNYSL